MEDREDGHEIEGGSVPLLRSEEQSKVTWLQEAKSLLTLAAGIVLARGSWVVIKSTDSALLGHVSTQALAAGAASDLWTQSTGVFSMGGVLGIFVGQALGAGNRRLASIWLQVSFVVVMAITVPVMVTWWLTKPVLEVFHTSEDLVQDASYFALVLSFCLPARTVFMQISQFMSAHSVVKPEAQVSIFAALFNLVVGLFFVLGVPVKGWEGFGFRACPWVTTSTEYVQLVVFWLVFGYFQNLHVQLGWTGWELEEVTWARIAEFLRLYVPSALSLASDFWRMAVIGVFAAQLGEDELAVFNASYRILWITLTLVGAVAFSVRIRLSTSLGAGDIKASKRSVKVGTSMTVCALFTVSLLVLAFIKDFARIFSSDEEKVIPMFSDCRVPFCAALFLMNLSVYLEQIPYAMGRTRAVFLTGVVGSWLGQVPMAYIAIHIWRKDLYGLYTGVAGGYALLCILLTFVITTVNYQEIIDEAQRRSEVV